MAADASSVAEPVDATGGDDAAGPVDANPAEVVLVLKAIGNAPKLKVKKFKVPRERTIHFVHSKVKKMLNFGDERTLFLYVDKFVPSPDETIENIYRCFGSGTGSVTFSYCEEVAFG